MVLETMPEFRTSPQSLTELRLPSSSGGQVPLGAFASVEESTGPDCQGVLVSEGLMAYSPSKSLASKRALKRASTAGSTALPALSRPAYQELLLLAWMTNP